MSVYSHFRQNALHGEGPADRDSCLAPARNPERSALGERRRGRGVMTRVAQRERSFRWTIRRMCGRYDLSENPAAIRAKFHVPRVPEFTGSADFRPTNVVPIIRLDRDAKRDCALARWGLVPHWAPDLKFGSKCFNARCETVATAPSFRAAVKLRRCLIPMNAFYEWSGPERQRIRHRINPVSQNLFAVAGLWEQWGDGECVVETYTIITCAASDALTPIHRRMPVILDDGEYDGWLRDARMDLLRPYGGELVIVPPPVVQSLPEGLFDAG